MENRREFLKKAGVAGGLGAAGALTLRKEYVKPVVRLLEPAAAYAQTPAISVLSAAWTVNPLDLVTQPPFSALTITLDVPGASAPAVGQTFNGRVSITNGDESGTGWGSVVLPAPPGPLPTGATLTSDPTANLGVSSAGGVVSFGINVPAGTVNGVALPPIPGVGLAMITFNAAGAPPNIASLCIAVDANAGATTGGNPYPAQAVGSWCLTMMFV